VIFCARPRRARGPSHAVAAGRPGARPGGLGQAKGSSRLGGETPAPRPRPPGGAAAAAAPVARLTPFRSA